MKVYEYRIPYKYGETKYLKPIFDVHYGNRFCDVNKFKAHLEDNADESYIIGGGDWADCILVGDKRYSKTIDVLAGNATVDTAVNDLTELLEPYKDRIIGLGMGNHDDICIQHGTNPMERLCKNLECEFLGYSWYVKLLFSEDGARSRTLRIRGHHGWGGGSRTEGADITKYSKDMAYWDADMFLYGHVHKYQSTQIDRMGVVGKKLVSKPVHLYICGTFLRTLSNTADPTYSEKAGYPPVRVKSHTIPIRPTRDWLDIGYDA